MPEREAKEKMSSETGNDEVIFDPIESQRSLLKYIGKNGGISLQDALKFAEKPEIWFGPDINILDVLIEKKKSGQIEFDHDLRRYKLVKHRR